MILFISYYVYIILYYVYIIYLRIRIKINEIRSINNV